jgi:hypothetical protein
MSPGGLLAVGDFMANDISLAVGGGARRMTYAESSTITGVREIGIDTQGCHIVLLRGWKRGSNKPLRLLLRGGTGENVFKRAKEIVSDEAFFAICESWEPGVGVAVPDELWGKLMTKDEYETVAQQLRPSCKRFRPGKCTK